MRLYFAYGLILFLLMSSCVVLMRGASPEELLVGKWEEVSWELERVTSEEIKKDWDLTNGQKQEIYAHMKMHDAETWTFDADKRLILSKQDAPVETLKWNVKGRGHILEIKQGSDKVEDFQVYELTNDRLVIYFNFDLQIRGIVKMTFKKVEKPSYAQKIQ